MITPYKLGIKQKFVKPNYTDFYCLLCYNIIIIFGGKLHLQTIYPDYWEFLLQVIETFTIEIPEGFDKPDFYFVKLQPQIDETQKRDHPPCVLLTIGDNYIDDRFVEILINPSRMITPYEL